MVRRARLRLLPRCAVRHPLQHGRLRKALGGDRKLQRRASSLPVYLRGDVDPVLRRADAADHVAVRLDWPAAAEVRQVAAHVTRECPWRRTQLVGRGRSHHSQTGRHQNAG